jgi:high-affinity Fe2+/Pb2+ permease
LELSTSLKSFNQILGVALLLGGAGMFWWVLREHRRSASTQAQRKWSPGFLWLLLFTAVDVAGLGIVLIVLR